DLRPHCRDQKEADAAGEQIDEGHQVQLGIQRLLSAPAGVFLRCCASHDRPPSRLRLASVYCWGRFAGIRILSLLATIRLSTPTEVSLMSSIMCWVRPCKSEKATREGMATISPNAVQLIALSRSPLKMWVFSPRRNCSLSTLAVKKRTWMRSMITAIAKTRQIAIGYMPKPPPFQ